MNRDHAESAARATPSTAVFVSHYWIVTVLSAGAMLPRELDNSVRNWTITAVEGLCNGSALLCLIYPVVCLLEAL